jgi:hypothetical protein
LAKMALLAAALLLSSAIGLTAAAPAQAVTDCKSAWGNSAACSRSAKVNIAPAPVPKPAPKPHVAAQPRTPTKPPAASAAKPQAAPRMAVSPAPHRQTLAKRPLPHRTAHSAAPHHTYAENRHARYRRNRQEWNAHGERQTASRDEYRPPSGPVYESGPGYAGVPPLGTRCDADCQYRDQQYRDWLVRYSAWYDRYGRTYGANQAPPANRYYGPAVPGAAHYGAFQPDQSERDRLDPWHGYNPHDGPGNGY